MKFTGERTRQEILLKLLLDAWLGRRRMSVNLGEGMVFWATNGPE